MWKGKKLEKVMKSDKTQFLLIINWQKLPIALLQRLPSMIRWILSSNLNFEKNNGCFLFGGLTKSVEMEMLYAWLASVPCKNYSHTHAPFHPSFTLILVTAKGEAYNSCYTCFVVNINFHSIQNMR